MKSPQGQPSESGGGRESNGPGSRWAFQHSSFRNVCGQLGLSRLSGRKGTFLLLGQARVGKSTLIRHALSNAPAFGPTAVVACGPQLSGARLLRVLSDEVGIFRSEHLPPDDQAAAGEVATVDQATLKAALDRFGRITIVLDAAERARDSVLELAHGLAQAPGDREGRLGLVLVGRPELSNRLDGAAWQGFKNEIAFRATLEPVGSDEVPSFIAAWLESEYARHAPVFSSEALARIAQDSLGMPETIIGLCRAAIDLASAVPSREINLTIAEHAIAALRPIGEPVQGDQTVVFAGSTPEVRPQPTIDADRPSEAAAAADSDVADGGVEPAAVGPEGLEDRAADQDEDWPELPEFELEDCEVEASNPEPMSVEPGLGSDIVGVPTPLSEPSAKRATAKGFTLGLALGLAVIVGAALGVWITVGSDVAPVLVAGPDAPAAKMDSDDSDKSDSAAVVGQGDAAVVAAKDAGEGERSNELGPAIDEIAPLPVAPQLIQAPEQPAEPGRPGDARVADSRLPGADPLASTEGRGPSDGVAGSAGSQAAASTGPLPSETGGRATGVADRTANVSGPASEDPPSPGGETDLGRSGPDVEPADTTVALAAERQPRDPVAKPAVQAALEGPGENKLEGVGAVVPEPSGGVPAAAAQLQSRTDDPASLDAAETARDSRLALGFRNEFERSLSELKRRNIQQALALLDLDPGPRDGVIGERSRDAIREFQASLGLKATGDLEPQLVALLFSRANAANGPSDPGGRIQQGAVQPNRTLPKQPAPRTRTRPAQPSQDPARFRAPDEDELAWLERLAGGGDKVAQTNLAQRYYHGKGVRRDLGAAAKWYQLAADQGDAVAQTNLGRLYFNGEGVPLDKRKAADWSLAAALQGNSTAQFNLGLMYKHGSGVTKDLKKALHWLRKAAEKGEPGASRELDHVIAEQRAPSQ